MCCQSKSLSSSTEAAGLIEAFFQLLTATTAAVSSRRGVVTGFSGATLALLNHFLNVLRSEEGNR